MKLSEAFNLYIITEIKLAGRADKTRTGYVTAQNLFIKILGDVPVKLITIEAVNRAHMEMEALGHQSTTIKGNLCKLRQVLKWLSSRGIDVLDYRLVSLPSIKRDRSKQVYLDYSEVQQMIDAATSERDKAIIACLFSTGCRISELLDLNREDIKGNQAVVLGKGSKFRTVYFDPKAIELLQAYLDTRKDKLPPLFVSGQYRRITVSRVEQILHVLTAEAGITKIVTPHIFRHSTITDYLSNGAPMAVVQKIAGHANIQTTVNIYGHIGEKHTEEAFNKFHSH